MQEVEGLTPTGGTYLNDFSNQIDKDIHTQSSWTNVIHVSQWRSVIAVSPNVGGGVCLIKSAKPYMCTQNGIYSERIHGAGCARPGFRTAEPFGERRYKNWSPTT